MPNMFWLSFNISQMMNDAETDEIRFKFPKWTKSYINGVWRNCFVYRSVFGIYFQIYIIDLIRENNV